MNFKPENAPKPDERFIQNTSDLIRQNPSNDQLVYLYLMEDRPTTFCRFIIENSDIVKIKKEGKAVSYA